MDSDQLFKDFDVTKFTYDGWEEDLTDLRNEIISPSLGGHSIIFKKDKMKRKQQISDGCCRDKSFLRLQNLNGEFTYEDFEADREFVMKKIANTGCRNCDMIVFELKQHLHDGDSSHPLLKEYQNYVSFCDDNPEWVEDKKEVQKILFDVKHWGFQRKERARKNMRKIDWDRSRTEKAKLLLNSERFNYPGFENDKEQILEEILSSEHKNIDWYLPMLKIRQGFHDGDESHPILSAFKNNKFTYRGWKEDTSKIKDKLLRDHKNLSVHCMMNVEIVAERMLTGSIRKQRIHNKKDLCLLLDDDVFDYEGFEEDKQQLLHWYTQGYEVKDKMSSILRKQKLHNGKYSHPVIDAVNQLNGIDEQTTRNSTEDDGHSSSVCIICLQHPRSHAFVPCGHMCLCDNCASRSPYSQDLQRHNISCPICRKSTSAIMKIYNS
ncbi:hypothetical protein CTEN210_12789 [Chaetoceros tenuissimus]|uniref:RING-type domain-containing protein n=1 Tax=Chaetoceros tenuissimus TaxID=426638 RepID=A0AAD3HAU7_9STRA|nr:hypothetical protein CTEN210_12789 [Chaetoceros tenuissimus]